MRAATTVFGVKNRTNRNYNDSFTFEHNDPDYLAYHLNQFEADRYVVDLSSNIRVDFLNRQLLGMENNGNTARFRANDRFDGLLFLGRSGVPQLTD